MTPPTDNSPPPLSGKAGANVSPHLKNLRNFVEQFIVERDGLTGETVLRVSDNMPVTCDEMSMMLLACSLAEKERADLLAALKDAEQSLSRLDDKDGAYRVTVLQAVRAVLSRATGSAGQD